MKTLNYEETLKIVSIKLTEIDNLSKFSKEHKLNYNIVCRFKARYTAKHYPYVLIATMEALGYKFIKKESCFSFKLPVT